MKKLILILLIQLFLIFAATSAWCQTFSWVKTGPSSTSSSMVRSATGDLFITAGSSIIKFDSTGNFQWQQTFSGFYLEGIVTDSIGNLFVAGEFNGTKSIGPYTVTANTSAFCIFLAKFDPSGMIQWVEQSFDNGSTVMDAISIDNMGNPLIMGRFIDSLQLASYVFDAPATNQVYLAKYFSSGGCIWAKHLAAGSFGGGSIGPKLKTDCFGNAYVSGRYLSWAQFDSITAPPSGSFDNDFVSKFDLNGNCIWLKTFGGDSDEYVYSFDVDRQGNSYISGYYGWPNCYFDSYTLTGAPTDNYYTAKYDSNGNFKWANLNASPLITACDQGFYTSTSYLSKYDTTGTLMWNKNVSGAVMKAIVAVGNDDVYVSGSFSGTVAFDTITLSASSTTMYLGKIGPSSLTTDVTEPGEAAFEVYPNPTTSSVFYKITGKKNCRIQLYSITGQLIYEEALGQKSAGTISLEGYAKGLYYLCVFDKDQRLYRPIVLN
jgi:hypothetical protein